MRCRPWGARRTIDVLKKQKAAKRSVVEREVPLSQVRDLLPHSIITTTERYDRQIGATLKQAAAKLDTSEHSRIFQDRRISPPR